MNLTRTYRGDYIKGNFVTIADPNGEVISRNPGDLDEEPLAFPFSYEHIGEAVDAAHVGFRSWRRIPSSDRYAAVARYRDVLRERAETVAHVAAFEGGKPLWEAEQEVQECIRLCDYYLSQPSPTDQEIETELGNGERRGTYRYFPKGVMAVISPSTMPAIIAHGEFIPALLHGNTIVLKSSKFNPMLGQALAEIANDSGLPAGVFNLLHGDAELSRRLVNHKDIQAIFFTGSHEKVLRIRKETASDYWKMLVLTSGGKNGVVVWEDANYQKALTECLYSAYVTAGQRFTSAKRLLVHESLFARFLDDFHQLSKKVRVDYGMDPKRHAFMGSLVSEAKMENYLRYQGIAVREGCEEIMRGKHLEKEHRGYYVSPSMHVVKQPNPKSIYQRESFYGPNVAFYSVREPEEAASILNQTQDGLVASLYSASPTLYSHLLKDVRVGMFHWNCPPITNAYRMPVAGIGTSGNQRPMGSFAQYQCTYPVSSVEVAADAPLAGLADHLPKLS